MEYLLYNSKYLSIYNVHNNRKEYMKFVLLQSHHIDNQSIYGVYYIGDTIYAIDGLYKLDGSDLTGELRYINEYRLIAIVFDGYRYFDIQFLNPGNIYI